MDIVNYYLQTKSAQQTADRFNVSLSYVYRVLRRHYVSTASKPRIDSDKERIQGIIQDYRNNMTIGDMKKKWKCSSKTIYKILSDNGVNRMHITVRAALRSYEKVRSKIGIELRDN